MDVDNSSSDSEGNEELLKNHPFVFYYAIGICLITEGLMWIFFHFCPNQQATQFTSSFLYLILVIATLCLHLKAKLCNQLLFGTTAPRHHHIIQKAYIFFIFTVIINALTITLGSQTALRGCVILYFIVTAIIGLRIFFEACAIVQFTFPHVFRFLLSYGTFFISGSLCLFFSYRDDWPISATLTAVTASHTFAYFFYHASRSLTKFWILPFMISMALGGLAVSIYAEVTTDPRLAPALSRALNQECSLLEFYDLNDLFAACSAAAAFFNAIAIMAIPYLPIPNKKFKSDKLDSYSDDNIDDILS